MFTPSERKHYSWYPKLYKAATGDPIDTIAWTIIFEGERHPGPIYDGLYHEADVHKFVKEEAERGALEIYLIGSRQQSSKGERKHQPLHSDTDVLVINPNTDRENLLIEEWCGTAGGIHVQRFTPEDVEKFSSYEGDDPFALISKSLLAAERYLLWSISTT